MEWYLGFGALFVLAVGAAAFGCCTGKASDEYPAANSPEEEKPKDISAPIYGFIRAVSERPKDFKFTLDPVARLTYSSICRITATDSKSGLVISGTRDYDYLTGRCQIGTGDGMKLSADEAEYLESSLRSIYSKRRARLKELKNIRARRELARLYT